MEGDLSEKGKPIAGDLKVLGVHRKALSKHNLTRNG